MRRTTIIAAALGLMALSFSGCPASTPQQGGGAGGNAGGEKGNKPVPTFTLAWSEYPSWSAFDVASSSHIIDGRKGHQGPVEKKWNVDIELLQLDYDTCITNYASASCDAVCITNTDILSPALGRDSVAILPTSTSAGADACLVVGIDDLEQLKHFKTYGLEKSVSEYCFFRCLQELGHDPADYQFVNAQPDAAATAMQGHQAGFESIQVWNPFVLQTLRSVPEAKVLFDSTKIPYEIIDMVVVGKSSLDKPGGHDFACAVIDAYYELNKLLHDPKHADEVLVAIGQKFSNLGLEDMKTVVEQTKFFGTADKGLAVFEKNLPEKMPTVVDFYVSRKIIDAEPKIVFHKPGEPAAACQLLFDPTYMEEVKNRR